VDYNLARLNPRDFEHLSQALAVAVLGPSVEVFGDGPDGGREAAFEGRFTLEGSAEPWEGYGVVQAKFLQRPVDTKTATTWLHRQIDTELKLWADPDRKRAKSGRIPEYFLVATNAVLSGVPDAGGVDSINQLIASHAGRLGLKGWMVWHYDKICRLLDVHAAVRARYGPYIAPDEVLGRVADFMSSSGVIEAGDSENERIPLGAVAVDLPGWIAPQLQTIEDAEATGGVAEYVLQLGDKIRRPSAHPEPPPQVVIMGGPGHGKSTLAQLLCQTYRLAVIGRNPPSSLSVEPRQLHRDLSADLERIGLPQPNVPRWPIQISLAGYGDEISGGEDISLLRHLAAEASRKTTSPVTANQLRTWLRDWPSLVVLDGLDEVASVPTRDLLLERISDFLSDAAQDDADLLLVVTSRPQGYADELTPAVYEHVMLRPLSGEEALRYANRLAAVRHRGDPDLREEVMVRLRDAQRSEHTSRLMRTPLQITIMSLLLERRTRIPQTRHDLFEAYYRTLMEREIGKEGSLGRLLEEQRRNIDYLHEQVGIRLHFDAQNRGGADATLSSDDLRRLALERFRNLGSQLTSPHSSPARWLTRR
jgi:hypothetical protein